MVLTSSYTASLSSMLTVQQLQPNVTSIDWLKKNNLKVGCSGNSFVQRYLEDVYNFKSENIVNITEEHMYYEGLKNRTIFAAFLERPYEEVFLNKYCKGYSGTASLNRYGGLGFVSSN